MFQLLIQRRSISLVSTSGGSFSFVQSQKNILRN